MSYVAFEGSHLMRRLASNGQPADVFFKQALQSVSTHFGVPVADITSPTRKAYQAEARFVVHLLMGEAGIDQIQIGRFFSQKRNAVQHGQVRCRELIQIDAAFRARFEKCKAELTARLQS